MLTLTKYRGENMGWIVIGSVTKHLREENIMGHAPSIWTNKKYGKKQYSGHYRRDQNGEREFILVFKRKNGTYHTISCESSVMAAASGWKLVNPRGTKQKTVRGKK